MYVFNNLAYTQRKCKKLCCQLKVFFGEVIKFRLSDHQKRGPQQNTSTHCICFHYGWEIIAFTLDRVGFTYWYISQSLCPEGSWFIVLVMMTYLWLPRRAIIIIIIIMYFFLFLPYCFACMVLKLNCINCATKSTYTRILSCFSYKIGHYYAITGVLLVWGLYQRWLGQCVFMNNP